jgi:thymidylate synthase (FAD)
MRAWRDFLNKRWHVAADAEIREFAGNILAQLKDIAPGCFQDFDTTNPIGG